MNDARDWIKLLREQTQWDADSLGAQTTRDGLAVLERVVTAAEALIAPGAIMPGLVVLEKALKGEPV
jgi:hypothetical protein